MNEDTATVAASDRVAGLEPEVALALFGAKRGGLTSEEAAAVRQRTGANELGRSGRTLPAVLLSQVRSPLLALLFVAAAVSIGVGERT